MTDTAFVGHSHAAMHLYCRSADLSAQLPCKNLGGGYQTAACLT